MYSVYNIRFDRLVNDFKINIWGLVELNETK